MSRFSGPKLPKQLLDQVADGRVRKRNRQQARKERRKQERTQKKQVRSQPRSRFEDDMEREQAHVANSHVRAARPRNRDTVPVKPVMKRKAEVEEIEAGESEDEESASGNGSGDDVEEEEDDDDDDYAHAPVFSKAVKAKLDEDDDEIARLEKKLGIKKGRKKVGDDELDWLVGGGGSGSDSEIEDEADMKRTSRKRAAPEDEDWLKQKRWKASMPVAEVKVQEDDSEDEDDFEAFDHEVLLETDDSAPEELENSFSEDELSGADFDDEPPAVKRTRENPYVAPVTNDVPSAGKYVPPSLRKAASSDEELLKQLRRQMQGQLNRLSEANILSILTAIQDIYAKNARQHCTSVLVDLLRERVSDPSDPGDNALILFAAFATALYRVIGTDFAAQLLESLVQCFDKHQHEATEGKQTINILSFLGDLYVLQTIGCDIIFEYIKMLLNNFSENNTVLLLRVVRICGQQLRQDDPSALKDIVLLLQRSVAAAGGIENVSPRSRFMIEFMYDLKNNKVKTSRGPDASAQEHMQRMKKTLGTIKNAKATEPLRIGLADIRDSEKKGKWWLVGASWRDPSKMVNGTSTDVQTTNPSTADADALDDADDSDTCIDLHALARAQGMNTDVRKAIFISIAGAVDPQHAHLRIMKLNLKNKQRLEIPRVVLHCVAAEPVYNHFYTLVATKFCSDRRIRKAWQFTLLDILRRCGEVEEEDTEQGDELSIRQIYNIAKTYATLISEGLLRISILKPLHFAALQSRTQIFSEVLLTNLFILLRKKNGKEGFGKAVDEVFGDAHFMSDMVQGLTYFVESVMPRSDVPANKKEKRVVIDGCEYASAVLHDEAGLNKSTAAEDESDLEGSIEVDWN